jgi:hypothetical protein
MRKTSIFLILTAISCFTILALSALNKPTAETNLTAQGLTVDTSIIDWGTFSAGASSTKTVTAICPYNATLTASLTNPSLADLDRYLTITVSPSTLMAYQPEQLELTLTAAHNTPQITFKTDITLTAQTS